MLGVPRGLYTRLAHADHQVLILRHRCRNLHANPGRLTRFLQKPNSGKVTSTEMWMVWKGFRLLLSEPQCFEMGGTESQFWSLWRGNLWAHSQVSEQKQPVLISTFFLSFSFSAGVSRNENLFFFSLDQSYYDYDYAERPAGEKCCNRN